jgi:hypothetical protein
MVDVGGEGSKCELAVEQTNLLEKGAAELMTAVVELPPFLGTLWQ